MDLFPAQLLRQDGVTAASAPWATKMRLAMSNPTVVISPMDGLFAMAESLSAFGTLMPGAEAIHPIKLNDVNARAWLADVLAKLPDHSAHRVGELMPWAWKARQEAAARVTTAVAA